jgi:hypothetical protein
MKKSKAKKDQSNASIICQIVANIISAVVGLAVIGDRVSSLF